MHKRCAKCNHHIWLKESVERGMGPVCAKKDTSQKLVWNFNRIQFEIKRKECSNASQFDLSKLRSDFLKSQTEQSIWFPVSSS